MDSSRFIPGIVSETLLEALGVPKGAPPPWQGRLHAFGVPFDFRSDVCRLRSPERYVEQNGGEGSNDGQEDPASASSPKPFMLETIHSETAGNGQDTLACEPRSRKFLAQAAKLGHQSAQLLFSVPGTLHSNAGAQAFAGEAGHSSVLANDAQAVGERVIAKEHLSSHTEGETTGKQDEATSDQPTDGVRRVIPDPAQASPSHAEAEPTKNIPDKEEEEDHDSKPGSASDSPRTEEPQRLRGSCSEALQLAERLSCNSVQRLRGSGEGRKGGLDLGSLQHAVGRGGGASRGRGSGRRGGVDLRIWRNASGDSSTHTAADDHAFPAASPVRRADASPAKQRPRAQLWGIGRGVDLHNVMNQSKAQIRCRASSPCPDVARHQQAHSPHAAARSPDTPRWDNRGDKNTPPAAARVTEGTQPRRGLLARLSGSPSPRPQGMFASGRRVHRLDRHRFRGRGDLDCSVSSTPTPNADSAGASPEDDLDDLWHVRSRNSRAHVPVSSREPKAPSLVVQHVRAELARVTGLPPTMAAQLEDQLVRGLEGVPGVDIAEAARITVQRVASAVLVATHGATAEPPVVRDEPSVDAAAQLHGNIDRRARALRAVAQEAAPDNVRARGRIVSKVRDTAEAYDSRSGISPAPQSPVKGREHKEPHVERNRGRGSLGLQPRDKCINAGRDKVKRRSPHRGHMQQRVSASVERSSAGPQVERDVDLTGKRKGHSGSADLDDDSGRRLKRGRMTREILQQEQRRREALRRCAALGVTMVSDDEDFRAAMDVTDTMDEQVAWEASPLVGDRGGFVRPLEGGLPRGYGVEDEEEALRLAVVAKRPRQEHSQVGMGDMLVKNLEESLGRKIVDDMPLTGNAAAAAQPQKEKADAFARPVSSLDEPKPVVIEVQGGSKRLERATSTLQDAWWHPRKDTSTLGPQYESEFGYPGLTAPLAGKATQEHKRAWAQPEFVPQRLVDTVRQASHTRVKQFFAYRHNEQGLAVAALAMGAARTSATKANASVAVK